MSFVKLGHHNGRLLGPKVGNSIKCLSQGHSDALLHRESNQGFATFRLLARRLYQLSYAAATFLFELICLLFHKYFSFIFLESFKKSLQLYILSLFQIYQIGYLKSPLHHHKSRI